MRKGQCFIAFYKLKNALAKLFSSQKFYHMSASPVPNSVMVSPVEGSTYTGVFYNDFKLSSSL